MRHSKYKDYRGCLYRVAYFMQPKPGWRTVENGQKFHSRFLPIRNTFEAAQADLTAFARRKGWTVCYDN